LKLEILSCPICGYRSEREVVIPSSATQTQIQTSVEIQVEIQTSGAAAAAAAERAAVGET
jgi:hypothetical protein